MQVVLHYYYLALLPGLCFCILQATVLQAIQNVRDPKNEANCH